jgi:multicomponent Na+:H+ antiporter subunit D
MSRTGLASLLPFAVAIPIAGAVLAPIAARVSSRLPLVLCLASLIGAAAVLGLIAPTVYGGTVLSHYMGDWTPVHGAALGVAFAADPFGLTYGFAVAGIGALLLLSTISELGGLGKRELGGYACLFQLLLAALIGAGLTADLFNLFVWFEVAALASYGLTGFFLERPIAVEAGFKILVLTTIASFGIFIGVALLYRDHGALNFGQLQQALAGDVRTPDLVALGLLIAGFATKAGLVPFHGWLADAHTAAPGPVSAMFSGLMVNLGILAIARIALQIYGPDGGGAVFGVLLTIGAISALVGSVLALAQDDLKRVLAYDTISQMGVLAVGLATNTSLGVAGMVYHLIDHALFKALLFLCAGAVIHMTGRTDLSEMGDLARRAPALAVAFTLGVFAISGVPPLNGYVSVGLIHEALLERHELVILVLLLAAQVITIAALARAAYLAFFRRVRRRYGELEPLRPGMVVSLSVLGAGCLVFGVLPSAVLEHLAGPSASALLHPGLAAHAVLSGAGRLPDANVSFAYLKPGEFALVAVTVVLGLVLARWYVRSPEPAPVRALRALHTGSVNDYAAFAVAGIVVIATVLLL